MAINESIKCLMRVMSTYIGSRPEIECSHYFHLLAYHSGALGSGSHHRGTST